MFFEPLTKKEKEVAELLLSDMTYSDIAEELNISITTAKTHIQHIYNKMIREESESQRATRALFASKYVAWKQMEEMENAG